jgi:hypothetical protein
VSNHRGLATMEPRIATMIHHDDIVVYCGFLRQCDRGKYTPRIATVWIPYTTMHHKLPVYTVCSVYIHIAFNIAIVQLWRRLANAKVYKHTHTYIYIYISELLKRSYVSDMSDCDRFCPANKKCYRTPTKNVIPLFRQFRVIVSHRLKTDSRYIKSSINCLRFHNGGVLSPEL